MTVHGYFYISGWRVSSCGQVARFPKLVRRYAACGTALLAGLASWETLAYRIHFRRRIEILARQRQRDIVPRQL